MMYEVQFYHKGEWHSGRNKYPDMFYACRVMKVAKVLFCLAFWMKTPEMRVSPVIDGNAEEK